MSAQVAADLRAAADVLERDGWTQNQYHNINGCHCVLGAIAVVVGRGKRPSPGSWSRTSPRHKRFEADIQPLQHLLDLESYQVPDWNDAPERTAAEVIAALRAAADRAEADQ